MGVALLAEGEATMNCCYILMLYPKISPNTHTFLITSAFT